MATTPEALAQLAQVLQGTLSPDQAARASAEQTLREFAPQPRFACTLTVLAVGEEAAAPLHLRQSAAILLRQFIKQCWDPPADSVRSGHDASRAVGGWSQGGAGDAHIRLGAEDKQIVKDTLPRGLLLPESKLQTACATAIGTIAAHDWPERWPSLLPHLVSALEPGRPPHHARGAMLCIRILLEDQMSTDMVPHLLPTLLPALQQILTTKTGAIVTAAAAGGDGTGCGGFSFSAATRCHALAAFREIVHNAALTLFAGEGTAAAATAAELQRVLPNWTELVLKSAPPLSDDAAAAGVAGHTIAARLALHIEAARSLCVCVEAWPATLAPVTPHLLQWTAETLVQLAPLFQHSTIMGEHVALDDVEIFDGGRHGVEPLVVELFDLLRSVATHTASLPIDGASKSSSGGRAARGKGKRNVASAGSVGALMAPQLGSVAHTVIGMMLVTSEQLEAWAHDPNQFIADDAEETLSYSARNSGADLLNELGCIFGTPAVAAVGAAATTRLREAADAASRGDATWWRTAEAAFAALGAIADPLIRAFEERERGSAQPTSADALPDESQLVQALQEALQAVSAAGPTSGDVGGDESDGRYYLRGRALWCAGKLVRPSASAWQAVLASLWQAALEALEPSAPAPVRVGSCLAVAKLAPALPRSELHVLVPPALERVAGLAVAAARAASAAAALAQSAGGAAAPGVGVDESLHMVLETIEMLLKLAAAASIVRMPGAAAQCPAAAAAAARVAHERALPLLIALWLSPQCSRDPMLLEATLDTIDAALTAARVADSVDTAGGLVQAMSSRVLPPVASVLKQALTHANTCAQVVAQGQAPIAGLPFGLVESTIHMLRKLVVAHAPAVSTTGVSASGGIVALAEPLLAQLQPLCMLLVVTDDHSTMQSGSECMRAYARVAENQIAAMPALLDALHRATVRVLDPALADSAALCIGGMATRLLLGLGGRSLPEAEWSALLGKVVERLLSARMTSLRQSLLFVLARVVLGSSLHTSAAAAGAAAATTTSAPGQGGAGLLVAFLRQHTSAISAVAADGAGAALAHVLQLWLDAQPDMMLFGPSGQSVSALALAELALISTYDHHFAMTPIAVEHGPKSAASERGVRTRSQRRDDPQPQVVTVPLVQRLLVVIARAWLQLSSEGDESAGQAFDDDDWEDEDDDIQDSEDEDDEDFDEEEWARSVGIDVDGDGGAGAFLLSDVIGDDPDGDDAADGSTYAEDIADANVLVQLQAGTGGAAEPLMRFLRSASANAFFAAQLEQCTSQFAPHEGKALQNALASGQ